MIKPLLRHSTCPVCRQRLGAQEEAEDQEEEAVMWTNPIEAVELDNREVIFAAKVEEQGVAAFSLINRMAIGPRCATL